MRKFSYFMTALALSGLMIIPVPAVADPPPGKLVGSFNISGHPKGVNVLKNDGANGRSIKVPLQNATGPNAITCEAEEVILTDDIAPTYQTQEPTGAKIYFVAGNSFDIIDRDATDRDGATIQVPTEDQDGEPVLSVDIYLRILGKPSTCMDIDAYAFDGDQGLYFWAGSVDLNRQTGKASWVRVNDLFDVFFCQVDAVTGLCIPGTTEELSVFNDVFESYFWNILNNGTRLVQARLYAR